MGTGPGERAGVRYATPLFHVADVERAIAFYEQLGFETIDTHGTAPMDWARLHCPGGAVMFLRLEEPLDPRAQAALLYLYTPDLEALRQHLVSRGVDAGPIDHPPHMPSGELCLTDPDGFRILVGHWGDAEHEAWLERLRGRGVS